MMGKRRGTGSPGGIHPVYRPASSGRCRCDTRRRATSHRKENASMAAKKKAPAKKAKKTPKKK